MVEFIVIICGGTVGVVQAQLFPKKSGFCALSELQENQGYGAAFFVTHQTKPFGFEAVFGTASTQLGKSFRFVYQEEITAIAQGTCSAAEKIFSFAAVVPTCGGNSFACWAAGIVGGIGNTAVIISCRDIPKIHALAE